MNDTLPSSDCPDCDPALQADRRRGIPVARIGQPIPQEQQKAASELIGDAVYRDVHGRLMMGQTGDLPEWAVNMMNEMRAMRIEFAALVHAVQSRGIVTAQELDAARVVVNQQIDAAMRTIQDRLRSNPGPAQPVNKV